MKNLEVVSFPVLETERLVLREMVVSDATQIRELRGNEQAMEFIPRPRVKSEEEAISFIESIHQFYKEGKGINWVVCLSTHPETAMGVVGLVNFFKETNGAEIGYMLHPNYWGKGYVPEAIKEVEKYGFETLKLNYLEAKIDPRNVNSKSVLLKNGYLLERSAKGDFFFEDKYLDTDFYVKNKL